MMNHQKTLFGFLVVAVTATGSFAPANAQTPGGGGPGTPTTSPSAPPAGGTPGVPAAPAAPTGAGTVAAPLTDEVPPGEAVGDEAAAKSNLEATNKPSEAHAAPAVPLVFPSAGVTKRRRVKPLRLTVGLDPAAPDFGGEADLISVMNEGTANVKPKRWMFNAHGFFRAPLRIGIGPGNYLPTRTNYTPPEYELHSPATHVVGVDNNDWKSVGLNPSPLGALYFTAGSAAISGTIIVTAQTFYDVGYKKLQDMGTISQAYLTMKFHDLFGYRGGLAVTAGAFSNRYGLAGPKQQSAGYYNTHLFGRTRVAGANVTANIDLTDRMELVFEAGAGAKIEVIPWLKQPAGPAPYLPEQGPTPQGSNFVYQVHPALFVDEWLKVAAHFMSSFTPNDNWGTAASASPVGPPSNSRMHVWGAEIHLDRPRLGSAYLGYAHVDAKSVLSLSDGIQLLHSPNGYFLMKNYFNPTYMSPTAGSPGDLPGSVGDSGKIDTVMFQYMVRMAPLFELPATGRDLTLAVYGMFNHVKAPSLNGGKQDKFKFGAEAQYAFWRYMSLGVRFDHVRPDGGNADVAYSVLSPLRLIFHTAWLSREYIMLSYSRYFLGQGYGPFMDPPGPANPQYQYDKNLVVLSAQIAF